MTLRLAFMGSPAFAVPALRALHGAGHEIAAVYAQPPRPAGRGQAVRRCAVHEAADALGLPVRTPARLRTDVDAHAAFAGLGLDAAVVAAYGLILPQAMLDAPQRGCLNIHASLLPRWRGAAPIQAAILAGDAETGVTVMQMDAGLDTGPMLLRGALPIGQDDDAGVVGEGLAALGGRLIVAALADPRAAVAQPVAGVSYAPKLSKADGRLDFGGDAVRLERLVRAMRPWPGAWTMLDGEVLKVHAAAAEPGGGGEAGVVLDAGLLVSCGVGCVRLLRVQRPGRPPMDAGAMLRGRPVPVGTRLG